MLEMTDDSGFLALVVPAAYTYFVASNWTFDQIMEHFKGQMARRSLLIWGTGSEGFRKVDVVLKKSTVNGYRDVSGPLQVVRGSLLLTNYESLQWWLSSRMSRCPKSTKKICSCRYPTAITHAESSRCSIPSERKLLATATPIMLSRL
jgi:hypothetical protein